MRLSWSRWFAAGSLGAVLVAGAALLAATRPHYGGSLRVEVRAAFETPEAMAPPAGFVLTGWDAGKRAVFTANENAAGGRPYLDSIEIQMGRPLRDQSIDLELGKADVVELGPNELRRQTAGRQVWSSSPVELMALEFAPRVEDARVREALALAVDRAAIHSVLLQRQGEISGALLPQWISGDAFLFAPAFDVARARSLVAMLPAPARTISLGVSDASLKPIADRIALNGRDAGLVVPVSAQSGNVDARLVEVRMVSPDPVRALDETAGELGLGQPPHADTPEALYNAERALLDSFRVTPLFHLPLVFGASPRVKGGPGITPLGEWHFENLWVEDRP